MEKIELGNTGITVSRLGLGTVKFGRNQGVKYPEKFELPDDAAITALLEIAREVGVNFLDTAPAYGTSEERIGKLLPGRREDWVISTKVGEEFENGESRFDFSPAHIQKSLERSLKRLKTDYVDILFIHSDGRDVEILSDELIRTLNEIKKSGKARLVGASTKTAAGGIRALDRLDIAMATYNPTRREEETVLDFAVKIKKPVLLKKILNSGNFTPSLQEGEIQEAFDFAFSHPGASAAIVGTITPERLRTNARATLSALSWAAGSRGSG